MLRTVLTIIMVALLAAIVLAGNDHVETPAWSDIDYATIVDRDHPLPNQWGAGLLLAPTSNRYGESFLVEVATLQAFEELQIRLAQEFGIFVEIQSAYRTAYQQQQLYRDCVRQYGHQVADRRENPAGFSEHQTGLALDLGLDIDGVRVSDRLELLKRSDLWAMVHTRLAEYGFILSYQENLNGGIGHEYEPWHIRFVTIPVARAIAEKKASLQEFVIRRAAPGK